MKKFHVLQDLKDHSLGDICNLRKKIYDYFVTRLECVEKYYFTTPRLKHHNVIMIPYQVYGIGILILGRNTTFFNVKELGHFKFLS